MGLGVPCRGHSQSPLNDGPTFPTQSVQSECHSGIRARKPCIVCSLGPKSRIALLLDTSVEIALVSDSHLYQKAKIGNSSGLCKFEDALHKT